MTTTSEPRRFDMLAAIDILITVAEVRTRTLEAGGRDDSQVFERLAGRLLRMLTGKEPGREHVDALLVSPPKEAA